MMELNPLFWLMTRQSNWLAFRGLEWRKMCVFNSKWTSVRQAVITACKVMGNGPIQRHTSSPFPSHASADWEEWRMSCRVTYLIIFSLSFCCVIICTNVTHIYLMPQLCRTYYGVFAIILYHLKCEHFEGKNHVWFVPVSWHSQTH